jgi:hypothetical protein
VWLLKENIQSFAQGNYFDPQLLPSYVKQLDDGISSFCG